MTGKHEHALQEAMLRTPDERSTLPAIREFVLSVEGDPEATPAEVKMAHFYRIIQPDIDLYTDEVLDSLGVPR